jgi:hypothetical protein
VTYFAESILLADAYILKKIPKSSHTQAIKKLGFGVLNKVIMRFDEAFWYVLVLCKTAPLLL